MNIIVVGGGKVGTVIASHLTEEGHDVTVIDNDPKVIEYMSTTFDVICYEGNGASCSTLRECGATDADLMIAVTDSDELNMLCCLTAHKLGARHTVARVRNPVYFEELNFLKEELGLSLAINPELAAAEEISRILRFPSAAKVELFARGRAELVECRLKEDSPLHGIALNKLNAKFGIKILICAVSRDGDVFIPSGDFILRGGDTLYITADTNEMTRAFKRINMLENAVKNTMIVGGGKTTYYLAKLLAKDGIRVSVFERDPARAHELCEKLPNAVIINGDASDHDLLHEEGLGNADALVALTGLDEGNIITSLYAVENGVRKVVAKVNNEHLVSLGFAKLESIISPKRITANHILRFVRAMNKSGSSVIALYQILDGRVEVTEFKAGAEGRYLDVPLKKLSTRDDLLIACIVRNGRAVIPGGDDEIHAGDNVLVVTSGKHLSELDDILK